MVHDINSASERSTSQTLKSLNSPLGVVQASLRFISHLPRYTFVKLLMFTSTSFRFGSTWLTLRNLPFYIEGHHNYMKDVNFKISNTNQDYANPVSCRVKWHTEMVPDVGNKWFIAKIWVCQDPVGWSKEENTAISYRCFCFDLVLWIFSELTSSKRFLSTLTWEGT